MADRPAIYDVRNYGAVGDGATDSTYAIQQAINDASTDGGGLVYLPPGIYIVSNLYIRSYVVLQGAGIRTTTLRLRSSAPAGANVLLTPNIALLTGKTGAELMANNFALFNQAAGRFTISSLTLDGNKANNPLAGSALDIYGYGYRMEHLEIMNSGGIGMRTEWPSGVGSVNATYPLQCSHHDIRIHECSSDGMDLNGPSDGFYNDLALYQNGPNAIRCRAGASGHKFTAYHIWGTNHGRGFLVESSGVNCANGTCEGASVAQYDIQGAGFVLTGGFQYSGVNEPNTLVCFRINAYTYRIDTRASRFGGGLVNWISDPIPGGYINVDGTVGVSSTLYTGTPSPRTFARLQIRSDVVSLPLTTNAYYHEPIPAT